ncbi:MAG TPA: porin [Macromonas sp.]|nr:porin [Macromonas sp.]
MKKSLISLAVLAAAGAASAQSSVTVYGIVDAYLGNVKNNIGTNGPDATKKNQTTVDSGGTSTSRVGVKGVEDLGNGLKASFQLEQGLAVDSGAALQDSQTKSYTGFDRRAQVGLSGAFGGLVFGRTYLPYFDLRSATDGDVVGGEIFGPRETFKLGNLGDKFASASGAAAVALSDYTKNASNVISYTSPNFNGFTAAVAVGLGENKSASSSAANTTSLKLQYANGPLLVGFGHQKEEYQSWGTSSTASSNTTLNTTYQPKATYNLLAGSYDFGVAKLFTSYQDVKYEETYGSSGTGKAKDYHFGVSVPVAANTKLWADYAHAKFNSDATGKDVKATGYTLGADYVLSKRTDIYVAYRATTKKNEAGTKLGENNVFGVGIKHVF